MVLAFQTDSLIVVWSCLLGWLYKLVGCSQTYCCFELLVRMALHTNSCSLDLLQACLFRGLENSVCTCLCSMDANLL